MKLRRIDYRWNLDGPLPYTSPQDVVKWVKESGFEESVVDIVKDVNEYFNALYRYGAVYDKFRYAEYIRDGISIKLNCGVERHNRDYHMEIWHDNVLVMVMRLHDHSTTTSPDPTVNVTYSNNDNILRFMAHCMIYTSMMLVDSILWNDSTDSINQMIIEEDLMKKTKAFVGEFKGHKTFGVWEVDNSGQKTGKFPIVSVGIRKAEALATHMEELGQFVTDNKSQPTTKFNTSKLSEDERDQLTSLLNKMS